MTTLGLEMMTCGRKRQAFVPEVSRNLGAGVTGGVFVLVGGGTGWDAGISISSMLSGGFPRLSSLQRSRGVAGVTSGVRSACS